MPAYRGYVRAEVAQQMLLDFEAMALEGNHYRCWWTDSTDLPRARNEALERAMADGLDYLMMQDSDIFAPNHSPMQRLLDCARHMRGTITGALCALRRFAPPKADGLPALGRFANVWPCRQGEVYEAEKIGTGMVLINCQELRRISADYTGPWFSRTYKDARQSVADVGEDVFFSLIVSKLGGRIICDATIPTVHVYSDDKGLEYRGTVPGK